MHRYMYNVPVTGAVKDEWVLVIVLGFFFSYRVFLHKIMYCGSNEFIVRCFLWVPATDFIVTAASRLGVLSFLYPGGVLLFHIGLPCVRLSVVRLSIHFSFPDDNLSKHQWILTKLGMCFDIVEICLGLLMGKFHQCLTELSARDTMMAGYSLTFLFSIQFMSIFAPEESTCMKYQTLFFWETTFQKCPLLILPSMLSITVYL